jgi:hypothetical protein
VKPTRKRLWLTIAEETGEVRSFPSFKAAKEALGNVPGTELHHIVEQSQGKLTRSGFPIERINSTDNLTRIPIDVHRDISAHYSRLMPGSTTRLRDALNGKSWDYQTDIGRDVLDRAMKGRDDER